MKMRKFEVIEKYKHLNPQIPKRATDSSAGYDLAAIEDVTIEPNEIKRVPTGLKVQIPKSEAMFIFARSSIATKKGLILSNGVGVVDSDYYNNESNEGHIMVSLLNIKDHAVTIEKGERVAQGIFLTYQKTDNDDTGNVARLGGFGSSGK
ncbi:MAG: dUTP diphosphatase [Tenericutes bacterium]|nr:dUTP diphosphatase [Mycoplasmatota bacterium]